MVAIGSVARSGATGRGTSRSLAACVPSPTVGRQQSGVADPTAVSDDGFAAIPIGQQGAFGRQQNDAIGAAATRRTTATASAHPIRNFAFRGRPAANDMQEE